MLDQACPISPLAERSFAQGVAPEWLGKLVLPRPEFSSDRTERSEERRSTGQIALGLFDSRLSSKCIDVVRSDVKNLIKLSQRFGETTESDIGNRVLGDQVNVARVEPLGFLEVCFAPVPLASPSSDIRQRLRNLTAIGK